MYINAYRQSSCSINVTNMRQKRVSFGRSEKAIATETAETAKKAVPFTREQTIAMGQRAKERVLSDLSGHKINEPLLHPDACRMLVALKTGLDINFLKTLKPETLGALMAKILFR